jgi:drug/metabolite transporter (DMT)-like permease
LERDRRVGLCTTAALCAFAGNSLLTRLALGHMTIDAATFATVRLAAGAAMLMVVTTVTRSRTHRVSGSWLSASALFLYAVPYSYAYVSLTAGTGTLILIGSVQITMMLAALLAGERPRTIQWVGLSLAFVGLAYLVLPGLAAPSLVGAVSMALAGIAWSGYSLLGRGATRPLEETTSNFVRALPLVIVVSVIARPHLHFEPAGILIGLACGALTSGLGYVLWYRAVKGLTTTRAAFVQLPVPILAGAGGVLFLGEAISRRLIVPAIVVIGGISLTLISPNGPDATRFVRLPYRFRRRA